MKVSSFYLEFLDATRQVCEDLGISLHHVKLTRYETEYRGLNYLAEGSSRATKFIFHVKTESKVKDPLKGTMTASLEIYYTENTAPFFIDENIDYMRAHQPSLPRWVAWAVFCFNLKHNPVNLESLFNGISLRVYGIPRAPYPGLSELRLLAGGLEKFHKGKIVVYKFRHIIESRYRAFSYAFSVGTTHHVYWAFFLEFGGMDSGGWSIALKEAEDLIKRLSRKKKVEIRQLDVEYERLEKFLKKHAEGFNFAYESQEKEIYDISDHIFGKDFAESFAKFEERYNNEDYPQAMRDLRALVQEAQEFVLRKKLGKEPDNDASVQKLGAVLVDNKVIDDVLRHWFNAFSSVANKSSHNSYPSKEDLEDYNVRNKIIIAFHIGKHLIKELEKVMELPRQNTLEDTQTRPFKVTVISPTQKERNTKQIHEESIGLPKRLNNKVE